MPTLSEAFAIAVQHQEAGRLQAAEEIYRQILAVDPNNVNALQLLGHLALNVGRLEDAATYISRAIELHGTESLFHLNLGCVFKAQGKLDPAIDCFRRALELQPNYDSAIYNLGTTLLAQKKLDEAVLFLLRSIEIRPDHAKSYDNLGTAYLHQEKYDEAVGCYRRAIHLEPGDAQTHFNLAVVLQAQGNFDAALASCCRALERKPDFTYARLSRSLLRLLLGDFEHGWSEYEWRWKSKLKERGFPQPKWDGNSLEQRTLLLHDEQGFGDTYQFIRYASLVKTHNPRATVIVECQRPLAKLLTGCPGIDWLIEIGDSLPPFDVHLPLLSLPGVFRTTLEAIPANVPYLFADQRLVEEWRERLAGISGFRIGINWHGRPDDGERRSEI
ncbi:MAG TPA: tetratricopeptide repeat protein [Pirellulaceae bacterium]|jgi:tetratricopeptide (TPR) repeat protein